MKANTKLTSVNVLDGVYKKFKVNVIEGNTNFQKLVNRSMDLYNNSQEFRDQINNHTGLAVSGSKF